MYRFDHTIAIFLCRLDWYIVILRASLQMKKKMDNIAWKFPEKLHVAFDLFFLTLWLLKKLLPYRYLSNMIKNFYSYTFLFKSFQSWTILMKRWLHGKCLNTEFFLVRIFLYSDWIQEEKTPYLDTFHAVVIPDKAHNAT